MAVLKDKTWIRPKLLAFVRFLAAILLLVACATEHAVPGEDGHFGGHPDDVGGTVGPTGLPFCQRTDPAGYPYSDRANKYLPPTPTTSAILVSTLDGKFTALDSTNGSQLWSHATGHGDLLSSTISNHEFTSQGKWVRLVPSLDGDLYTFDGENMGAALASVDALLSNSLKMSDDTVVTGGKEVHTYAIDLKTGQLRYSCGVAKCQYYNTTSSTVDDDDKDDDVLLLNLLTKTVRAVSARNGSEKWNYSVGQHDAQMAPMPLEEAGCHTKGHSGDRLWVPPDRSKTEVKFVPAEGMVLAFTRSDSYNPIWDHKFATPIVHAWKLNGREVQPLDLFENSFNGREEATKANHDLPRPILYIGTYNKQLYIIESRKIQANIPLEYKTFGIDLTSAPPQVIWQPYLFTAQSRTPTILGRRPPNDLALISHVGPEESTALVVSHNGIEYPFDNGFYLYPSQPLNINAIHIQFDGETFEPEPETFDQIIIISLWYWWKEVLAISVTFAVLVNLCITRHFIRRMQNKFMKENGEFVEQVPPSPGLVVENAVNRNSQSELTTQSSSESVSSMATPPTEFVSRYLTDFEPVQILGKGGFGVVFHARNKIDDCEYAIKRICMPNKNECKERIMREVKALAKLDHAGIVRYYNSWLECPPPHWQEKVDRQWSTSGEGFLTPSASMTMDELQRAYGLRTGGRRLKFGRTPSSSSLSASSLADRDGDAGSPQGQNTWRDRDCADIQEGDSVHESTSSGRLIEEDAIKAPRRNSEVSDGSYIVFADESVQENGKSKDASDILPGNVGTSSLSENPPNVNPEATADNGRVESSSGGTGKQDLAADLSAKRRISPLPTPFVWEKPDRLYLYIQMQLCRKDSLKDWLSANTDCRNKFEMLDFLDQIVSAVEYVHEQGLMHRDLKPSNIFFALDGSIKVGDFGLVAATMTPTKEVSESGKKPPVTDGVGGAAVESRHTNQVGTMLYMSPEQIAGENYDHKVDIYSMGLIFFEMLVPFTTGMERVKTMSEVRQLRFPANFVNEYIVEHSLVAKMVTHVPNDRPTASEVKHHPLLQDFQPRPELLRWNRRPRTTSRTFSTSSSGSGGIDIQFQDGSGDSVCDHIGLTTYSS